MCIVADEQQLAFGSYDRTRFAVRCADPFPQTCQGLAAAKVAGQRVQRADKNDQSCQARRNGDSRLRPSPGETAARKTPEVEQAQGGAAGRHEHDREHVAAARQMGVPEVYPNARCNRQHDEQDGQIVGTIEKTQAAEVSAKHEDGKQRRKTVARKYAQTTPMSPKSSNALSKRHALAAAYRRTPCLARDQAPRLW